MKHTPSPWEAVKVKTSVGYCWQIGPFKACIYRDSGGICNENLPHPEAEANARLIAAAPELLECCRWLLDYAPTPSDAGRVKAVIAKAMGENL